MPSINDITIELNVKGEKQADAALKRFKDNKDKLTRSVLRSADKVNTTLKQWDRATNLYRRGTISLEALNTAQNQLARELASVNGYIKSNGQLNTNKAKAEIRAAEQTRRHAQETEAAAREQKRYEQRTEELRRQFDRQYAAFARARQAIQDLREAKRRGILTTEAYANRVAQVRQEYDVMRQGGRSAQRSMNDTGIAVQQVGFQISDFATQVQAGTSTMLALSQQGSQLVGILPLVAENIGLTTGRAIALSAGLGIAIPVLTTAARVLFDLGEGSKTLKDRFSDLDSSTTQLQDTMELLRVNVSEMEDEFGSMSTAMQNLARDTIALDKAAQAENIKSLLDTFVETEIDPNIFQRITAGLAEGLAQTGGAMPGGGVGGSGLRRQLLESFESENFKGLGLDMGRATFDGYVEGIQSSAEEGDVEGVTRGMVRFIRDAVGETGSLSEEAQSFLTKLRESAMQQARLNRFMEEGKQTQEETNRLLEKGRQAELQKARTNRQTIIDMENELEVLRTAAEYGEESVEVARLRAEQEAVSLNLTTENQRKYVQLALSQREARLEAEQTADATDDISIGLQRAIDNANAFAEAIGRAQQRTSSIGLSSTGLQAQLEALRGGASELEAQAEAEAATLRERLMEEAGGPLSLPQATQVERQVQERRQEILRRGGLHDEVQALLEERSGGGGGGGGGPVGDQISDTEKELQKLAENLRSSFQDAVNPHEAYNEKVAQYRRILNRGMISQGEFNHAVSQLGLKLGDSGVVIDDFTKSLQDNFESTFNAVLDGSKTLSEGVSDVFLSTMRMVTQEIFSQQIAQPAASGITSFLSDITGGLFQSGGAGGSSLAPSSSPIPIPRASGGPVMSGQSYLVGEQGPELFQPSTSGQIRPNHMSDRPSSDSRPSVTVNMNISTPDAESFRRSEGQVGLRAARALSKAQGRYG